MASFCPECGRPLLTGEVCTCQKSQEKKVVEDTLLWPEPPKSAQKEKELLQSKIDEETTRNTFAQRAQELTERQRVEEAAKKAEEEAKRQKEEQAQNAQMTFEQLKKKRKRAQATAKAGNFFGDCGRTFLGLILTPTSTAHELAEDSDWKKSGLFILLHAVLMGFFVLTVEIRTAVWVNWNTWYTVKFPYVGSFFLAIVAVLFYVALFAGLLFVKNTLTKQKQKFFEVLSFTSILSWIGAPMTLIAILCATVNVKLALFVIAMGIILAIMMFAIENLKKKDSEHEIMFLFAVVFLHLLLVLLITYGLVHLMIPDILLDIL